MTIQLTIESPEIEANEKTALTKREWAFVFTFPVFFIGAALLGIVLGRILTPIISSFFWTSLPIYWLRLYQQILSSIIGLIVGLIIFLVAIPKIYRIPLGIQSIRSYLHYIKVDRVRPIARSLLIFFPILCFILISQIIASYSYNLLLLGHDFASVTSSLFDPIRIQAAIGLGPITANGSIFEEIVLRGIVLTLFLKAYSKRKAIVMSAVAFGVMHYLNLMNGPLTFNSFIFVNGMVIWTTIHGLMYAVMFLKVGNLFPNMALHWTVNGLGNCLILLPGSSTVTYVLFNILFNIGLMSSILGIAWILLVNKYWPLTGNE